MPGKDRHTGPSGWGIGRRAYILTSQNPNCSKPEQREGHGLKTIQSAKDKEEKGERG
jgi:hypothetical protein